jgi:hypothetical protein
MLDNKYAGAVHCLGCFGFVSQNAINIVLCLRIANSNTALPPKDEAWRTGARWVGEVETVFD